MCKAAASTPRRSIMAECRAAHPDSLRINKQDLSNFQHTERVKNLDRRTAVESLLDTLRKNDEFYKAKFSDDVRSRPRMPEDNSLCGGTEKYHIPHCAK